MNVRLTAAIADGSLNVKRFCEEQGISRTTFYKWRDRYRSEGLAGLEERSRRPKNTSPGMPADVEDRIVELRKTLDDDGLDAGAATIWGHLVDEGWDPLPSEASIWRALTRRGFITPQAKKRPRSSYKTFVFDRVNECWQIDHYDWYLADGTGVQTINILDDHSRVVSSKAFPVVTCEAAWTAFLEAADDWGFPGMVLTDNDLVYNGSRRNITVAFEANLQVLGIRPITSTPYHPQTCGKVERYHQTEQKWLKARPLAGTIEELNQQLGVFNDFYNHKRKHRSLNKTIPAHVHQANPKTGPADRPLTNTRRVTTGKVAVDGSVWSRPYRIAVGRAHAGTPVTTIIDEDQAYIFARGQLLRHLTLDPTRQNQPLTCPR
jgi:transposase InsO family protein